MTPKGYPVFAISNHTNAVMDPLAMLYMYKDHRQPVYIARGDVFKKEFIAKLLRFLKILPTFRSRDGGRDDVKSNLETFALAARILNEGGTLTMFPEAGHQAGKFFNTFKKGFPRVAFAAAEKSDYTLDFKILPMYIYYTNYFNMRGRQVIVVGEPFAIDEFYDLYKSEPNTAYMAMNQKAREAVRRLGIDVLDHEQNYPQYDMIFKVCRSQVLADPHAFDELEVFGTPEDRQPKNAYAWMLSDKKLNMILEKMKEQSPERYEQVMQMAAEYREGLQTLRLRDWLFEKKITGCKNFATALLLLLTSPIALTGAIGNIVPFKVVELFKKDLKDPMFKSTLNFVPSVVFFPVWYIIMFVIVCIAVNWWVALLTLLVAGLTFVPFFDWKKTFVKLCGMCRFRKNEKSGNTLLKRLKELRENLRNMVK